MKYLHIARGSKLIVLGIICWKAFYLPYSTFCFWIDKNVVLAEKKVSFQCVCEVHTKSTANVCPFRRVTWLKWILLRWLGTSVQHRLYQHLLPSSPPHIARKNLFSTTSHSNLPWQSNHYTITILSDDFQVKWLCLSPANPFPCKLNQLIFTLSGIKMVINQHCGFTLPSGNVS